MSCFWISFCDVDKPKGSQFIGVIIIDSMNFDSAIKQTHSLKINPGGEISSWQVNGRNIPLMYFNRLLSTEQVDELEKHMAEGNSE